MVNGNTGSGFKLMIQGTYGSWFMVHGSFMVNDSRFMIND